MDRMGGHDKFVEEARFAGAHELGMALRWGLSRVVRVEGGREVRGLLSWAWYERWRAEESGECFSFAVSFLLCVWCGPFFGGDLPCAEIGLCQVIFHLIWARGFILSFFAGDF
ncbi:hypothetical protein K438DRAFT_1856427 [Mycena galopus ATCC 62051]|nr:hypothetical protein K438DRAFT_1856427 [Mycena galopus ATCC 62051]